MTWLWVKVRNKHHHERLMEALEWNGNIEHDDINLEGAVQSANHLDLEYKMRAASSKAEEHLMKLLKSGQMLADAKKFLKSVGSPVKLLHIEKPRVGYHMLHSTAAERAARQSENGFTPALAAGRREGWREGGTGGGEARCVGRPRRQVRA